MLLIEKILQQFQTGPSKALLNKARLMVDDQAVLMVRLSDGFLMARIKDEHGQIHTVNSHLRQWDNKNYKCTCGKMMPCIHLFAGMLDWLEKNVKASKKENQPSRQFQWIDKEDFKPDSLSWESNLLGDEVDGFQLELKVNQQDEQWNIIDVLVHLLETHDYYSLMKKDDQLIFQIVNATGHKLSLPWGRLKWLLQRIVESGQKNTAYLRLKNDWNTLKQFHQWSQESADHYNQWHGNQAWKNMLWLLQPELLPLEDYLPKHFNCELRTYQQEGIRWLRCLQKAGYGGILADDMGLGKTIQTLAFLLSLQENGLLNKPALIVVPTSLLANWQDECKNYAPDLNVSLFHSKTKKHRNWENIDLIVTTYGMVQRHPALFTDYHFSLIILDEAQLIKNFQSQKSMVLKKCQADMRLCLSGTPMENHLGELWSLLDFAVPQLLGTRTMFRKNFQVPIEVEQHAETKTSLLARIQPFLLRRTKSQVLKSLPQKTTVIQKVLMEPEQLELYESFRAILAEKVQTTLAEKGLVQSRWVVLDALLKLRQICCDPRLLPQHWLPHQQLAPSAKLERLMDMLENLVAEGRSVLVFSQFTKMLNLIELELQKRNYPYFLLTGQTQKREVIVDKFQKGEVPIFLLSLKAGGLGLNLTRADTVIHYEPWWNPAVTAQATDRIHRIGQEQPVFEYHLIIEGSIEQSMLSLQQKKQDLFSSTVEATGNTPFQWTEDDILKFFAPIG